MEKNKKYYISEIIKNMEKARVVAQEYMGKVREDDYNVKRGDMKLGKIYFLRPVYKIYVVYFVYHKDNDHIYTLGVSSDHVVYIEDWPNKDADLTYEYNKFIIPNNIGRLIDAFSKKVTRLFTRAGNYNDVELPIIEIIHNILSQIETKSVVTDRKNNDGLETCFICGAKTKKIELFSSYTNYCVKCKV